jgi:hypothetical protein
MKIMRVKQQDGTLVDIPIGMEAASAVSTHNSNTSAHADIREAISQLSSEKVNVSQLNSAVNTAKNETIAEVDNMLSTEVEIEVENQLDGMRSSIVAELIKQIGGLPVFGTVDDDKIVTVTSALGDGTYVLRYKEADGSYSELCTFIIGNGDEPEGPVIIPLSWNYGQKATYAAGEKYSLSTSADYSASDLVPVEANKTYISTVKTHSYTATSLSYRVVYVSASNTVISSETLSLASGAVRALTVPADCYSLALRVFSTDQYSNEEICALITLTKE